MSAAVAACGQRLQVAASRLHPRMDAALRTAESAVREQHAKLNLLNPYAVLERGYSITTDAEGRIVRKTADVASGDLLSTRLSDGTLVSTVQ